MPTVFNDSINIVVIIHGPAETSGKFYESFVSIEIDKNFIYYS